MKKWMNGLLAFVLAFTLTACGAAGSVGRDGGYAGQADETTQTEQSAETQEDAESEQQEDEQVQSDAAEAEDSEEASADGQTVSEAADNSSETTGDTAALDEDGTYTSKEDVAVYIHTYGHLPNNFITKKEAEKLGWSGGSLEPYAPGKCIGGSRFGNYEGILPEKDGRKYTECDIDTLGASKRGAKRIVFSNDGLIYYTGDHYETFELLYGEE